MSGSCAAMILMGTMGLILSPFVILGAALSVAAAATVALAKGLVRKYGRTNKRKKMKLGKASDRLTKTYENMEASIEKVEKKKAKHVKNAALKLEDSANDMKKRQKDMKDSKELKQLLTDKRAEWKNILKEELRDKEKEIYKTANQEMDRDIALLQEEKRQQAESEVWKSKKKEDREKQKILAETELHDAEETMILLKSMAEEQKFSDQNAAMNLLERQLDKTKELFSKGLYETAFAGFQDVVVKGANLAKQNALEYQERMALQAEVEARIEALIMEANERRELTITNEETGQTYVEDLNDFCQDGFEKLVDSLEEALEHIKQHGNEMTVYHLEKALIRAEEDMILEIDDLVDTAAQAMQAYYKKLQVLEIIAEFMEEQGYDTNWIQPEGDDLSRKLVVNFVHQDTGNAVSFTVDMEQDGEEMSRMLMDMMIFYEEREVTEFEKQKLREHINQVLNDNGIKGGLECSGDVGTSCRRVEYNQREAVKNMVRVQ